MANKVTGKFHTLLSLLCSIFLLFSVTPTFCQKEPLHIIAGEEIIGSDLRKGQQISARTFTFPEEIYASYISEAENLVTVQLRGISSNGKWWNGAGQVILYDFASHKVKWSKRIVYEADHYEQTGPVIVKTNLKKSFLLDIESGEPLWEVKNILYHIDSKKKIGIGYKSRPSTGGITNTLEGIHLNNGTEIWKREIYRELGWNDLFYLNDSILIVVAAGMHAVNIYNGKGWDYHAVTGKKDHSGTIAANALGVVTGILTGTFISATGHNLVRDLVSNVLPDSTSFYLASTNKLSSVGLDGQLKWSTPLDEKLMSKSTLFFMGDRVYLVNRGFAFMGDKKIFYGKPFIAAFDRDTGKEIFKTVLQTDAEMKIESFTLRDRAIYFLLDGRLAEYSLDTGLPVRSKTLNDDAEKKAISFVGNQYFTQKADLSYKSLYASDSSLLYVYTQDDKVLSLNNNFVIVEEIEGQSLWTYYATGKGFRLLANQNKTIILDDQDQAIAELDASRQSLLIGKKLYQIEGRLLIETDLESILKQ